MKEVSSNLQQGKAELVIVKYYNFKHSLFKVLKNLYLSQDDVFLVVPTIHRIVRVFDKNKVYLQKIYLQLRLLLT